MAREPRKVNFPFGPLYLRDTREANWGWFQRELLDFFAPLVGPYAVAVYICLCHAARGNDPTARLSLRSLEGAWTRKGFRPALSRSSIARGLKLLEAAGMIRLIQPATNRQPPTYALVSLPQLASELDQAGCDNLALVLEHQRQRFHDEEEPGVPQGDARKLCKTSGKACQKAVISTEFRGTPESPRGAAGVPQGHSLLIKKEEKEYKPPSPPLSGGLTLPVVQNCEPGDADA